MTILDLLRKRPLISLGRGRGLFRAQSPYTDCAPWMERYPELQNLQHVWVTGDPYYDQPIPATWEEKWYDENIKNELWIKDCLYWPNHTEWTPWPDFQAMYDRGTFIRPVGPLGPSYEYVDEYFVKAPAQDGWTTPKFNKPCLAQEDYDRINYGVPDSAPFRDRSLWAQLYILPQDYYPTQPGFPYSSGGPWDSYGCDCGANFGRWKGSFALAEGMEWTVGILYYGKWGEGDWRLSMKVSDTAFTIHNYEEAPPEAPPPTIRESLRSLLDHYRPGMILPKAR